MNLLCHQTLSIITGVLTERVLKIKVTEYIYVPIAPQQ